MRTNPASFGEDERTKKRRNEKRRVKWE